jgi:hypothetical protein
MKNLKPDSGKPLCMNHQSRALFAASRVPIKKSKDSIHVFDKSNHVAVMCFAQLYYFQALWPDDHCAIDEGGLVDILSAIHSHAIAMDPVDSSKSAIGVLTSLNRNEWATAREDIIKNPKNKEGLQIVDSALFVLVLDDYIPKNKHSLLFGDAWAPQITNAVNAKELFKKDIECAVLTDNSGKQVGVGIIDALTGRVLDGRLFLFFLQQPFIAAAYGCVFLGCWRG